MKKLFMAGLGICLLGAVFASQSQAEKMLQIKGSDTLINVVQKLAEVYMTKNPGKFIAVTGGGSGTGIAALINSKCDIANASRLMKDKEIEQASTGGVEVHRVVVAIDGLSIITHSDNSVKQITVDELGKIFRGEISNWKELGGQDMAITLYGRQPNSGTFDFMKEVILKGEYSSKMNQMNGNAQIVEAVKRDASGIGYTGVGYVRDVTGINVLKIASKVGGEYLSPLDTAVVKNGEYPVTRPLNQYIKGNLSADVKDFISFELSDEGQKIIEEEGFFAIPADYQEFNKKAGL